MNVLRWLLTACCAVPLLLCSATLATGAELRLQASNVPQLDVPALGAILKSETGVTLVRTHTNLDPLRALSTNQADLAVVENTRPFVAGVRTVLPLFSSVVHMAVREDLNWEDFTVDQRPPVIELLGGQHTAHLVSELLFSRATTIPNQFVTWTEELKRNPDFIVYVGPLLPRKTDWFRPGFRLASMGRVDSGGAEFYTEGISHLYPQLRPERIPALTYSLPGNETGIDALSVDMLMVARRDADPVAIYRMVEVLLEQKARFAAAEPQLFRWLREDFDQQNLNFPLHQGTRDYLARDEPGFLERYAETLNFIVYLVALTVTGIVALGRWRAKTRKDRIDTFYERLIALRRDVGVKDRVALLSEITVLEEEAFGLLVRERLAADDSFRIFMDLAANLRRELQVSAPGKASADSAD